jgi:hypothetical protein
MKYIKTFEYENPKFKEEDYVFVLQPAYPGMIFQINSKLYDHNGKTFKYFVSSIDQEHFIGWVKEYQLKLVPDHEVAAHKYNL